MADNRKSKPTRDELLRIIEELSSIIEWVGTPRGFSYEEFYPPQLQERVRKALTS